MTRAMPRYVERREERLENIQQTSGVDADAAVLHLQDAAAVRCPAGAAANAAPVRGGPDRIEQRVLQAVADHARLAPDRAQARRPVQLQFLTALLPNVRTSSTASATRDASSTSRRSRGRSARPARNIRVICSTSPARRRV